MPRILVPRRQVTEATEVRMKVVVFAASKGGASKTTLLHNCSIYAASVGRGVLIADLDPQKSLSRLWDLRGELINPRLVTNITRLSQSVAMLSSAGYDKEFLLVDTPGSVIPTMREAIAAADVLVLPTRPNPVDLKAQNDVLGLVSQVGKLDQSLFVLTQTEQQKQGAALIETAKEFIHPYSKHPILEMPRRLEYARAQENGGAGCEKSKDCRNDIKKIWDAIVGIAGEATIGKEQPSVRIH